MFIPENDLERALVRAADDKSARAPFLKTLLDAELAFALTDAGQEGYRVPELEEGGEVFVPIFTSEKRVQPAFGEEKMFVVKQTLRQILQQVEGAHFVLNPGSDYGRELFDEDIKAMLAGDFEKAAESDDERPENEYDLPTAVGRPTPTPTHLITPLTRMFAAMREVKSAHIAQAIFPDPDGTKRLVIGVSTDGDLDFVLDRVTQLLDRVAKPSDVIDFVPIPGSPLDGYFERDVNPFYKKADS
ncbi:enhanced serine sensitivity protein SseB C-terminal domain-containing protein [Methylopila sp. M107]|uniref:enhanced serine sensitivity protein SseB C-terminal domain-containing protein n=1 Tax=Methylopila sp. M107 TaxID=1101190 RepID=UPI0003627A02|nr:enhanced serine sensitivity protein SseB C-terminal domain-containing protein [Methylopila sp. M107]